MKRCIRLYKQLKAALDVSPPDVDKQPYNLILGKRHVLRHPTYLDDKKTEMQANSYSKPGQDFRRAQELLSKIEDKSERKLLAKYARSLSNEEKSELYASWRRRKFEEYELLSKTPNETAEPPELPDNFDFAKVLYMTEEELQDVEIGDVGRYIQVTEERAKHLFRNGYFGEYMLDEYAFNSQFNVMIREETVKLIKLIKLYQNVDGLKYFDRGEEPDLAVVEGQGPDDFSAEELEELQSRQKSLKEAEEAEMQAAEQQLVTMSRNDQLQWLIENSANTYVLIYKHLGSSLNKLLEQLQDPTLDLMFRNSPILFEGSLNMILQELHKDPLYDAVFETLPHSLIDTHIEELNEFLQGNLGFTQILRGVCAFYKTKISAEDAERQLDFKQIARFLTPVVEINLPTGVHSFDLKNYENTSKLFKLPAEFDEFELKNFRGFNSNILLTGQRGCGKSQVLSGLALWAHNEGNWIVVRAPRVSDFTRNPTTMLWHPSGPYVMPDLAVDVLEELKLTCGDKLAKVQVKHHLYGKFNLAALHDEYNATYLPLPALHKWDEVGRVHTDDWKLFYSSEIIELTLEGLKEYPIAPRKTRIDVDIEKIEETTSYPGFNRIIAEYGSDDELALKSELTEESPEVIKAEGRVFHIPKTKSKKRPRKFHLPKTSSENLKYSHRLHRRIGAADMSTDTVPLYKRMEGAPIATRVGDKLKSPFNLLEILEFGIQNPVYATNALAEILEQLYHTDSFNVLILVDEANELFRPSQHKSIKYVNIFANKGVIPPHDIALCRLFMRFDGHRIKNGLKVYAASEKYMIGQKLTPKKVNLPNYVRYEVQPMCLNEFRNMVFYYKHTEWLDTNISEADMENAYMNSQGNWYSAHQYLSPFIGRYK